MFLTTAVEQGQRGPGGSGHKTSPLLVTWVSAWCITTAESFSRLLFHSYKLLSLAHLPHYFFPAFQWLMPLRAWVVGQAWQAKVPGVCVVVSLSHDVLVLTTVCICGAGSSGWDPGEGLNGALGTSTSCCDTGSHPSVWPLLPLVLPLVFSFYVCQVIWNNTRNFSFESKN